jgi:hypothetical protein
MITPRFIARSRSASASCLAAGPVAFLVQRFFLRVGTPIKTYPALGQPNGGRRWPVERLEILTRVTPDILDPTDATPSGKDRWYEAPNGRIYLRANDGDTQVLPGLVFWPRVRARDGGEVNFELEIDARGARTRLPLIFVGIWRQSASCLGSTRKAVFADGALPTKTKQIIAVAVAHVTECPYCINGHT